MPKGKTVKKSKTEEMFEDRLGPVEAAIEALGNQLKMLTQVFEKTSTSQAQGTPHQSTPDLGIELTSARSSEQGNTKISGIPQPEKLEEVYTFAQFQDWRRRYVNYLRAQGAHLIPTEQTNAVFFSFLGQEISDVLRLVLNIPFGSNYEEVLDELDKYYRKKENGRIRRSQFTCRKQEEGESFMSFYREKMKLFHISDPCSHCYERFLADNVIESLRDEKVRRKCRALPDSSKLSEIVKICEADEMVSREEDNIERVSKVSRSQKKCPRCGNPWHQTLKECPARDSECRNCKSRGHFTKTCRSRKPVRRIMESDEEVDEVTIRYMRINGISRQTNSCQFNVSVTTALNWDVEAQCLAIPDTGAEVCVAGLNLLKDLQIDSKRLSRARITLTTANGSHIKVMGKLPCVIRYENRKANLDIYICSGVQELLVDRVTLKTLGVIHQDFPRPLTEPERIREVNVITENPSVEELEMLKEKLIREYVDVFDTKPLKPMKGQKVHIVLKDNAVPFAVTCPRKVPFAWRSQVKQELDDMVAKNIIIPSPEEATDYVSPLVVVPKPNGKIRLCVDFTNLNKHVKRPVHPFKAPWEAVSDIGNGNNYFSSLDAASGYFQLQLDDQSQKLTTFLTPWGRYQFLRAPMGLVSSGDEFCRRGDEALSGIGNIQKVVDDILAYDKDFKTHYIRIKQILDRCRAASITLNKDKFVFAKPELPFVGYIVGQSGIKVDPKKLEAISKFPEPRNLTELRSFLGMVNQLGSFSPNISAAAGPLRELLSMKNVFLWSSSHNKSFEEVKRMLTEPPVLTHFELDRKTALHVDASRINGLGYVLLQEHSGVWKLIQCGSRFISDTERRYAMIEIEMLGIAWAVTKCKMYLQGLPSFVVVCDHKPLLPILNGQTMDAIQNPRLQRLKGKLAGFNFTAEWKKGKTHLIPDSLSRAPVSDPEENDLLAEEDVDGSTRQIFQLNELDEIGQELQDPTLTSITDLARTDNEYQALKKSVEEGFPPCKRSLQNDLLPYWSVKNDLTLEGSLILKGCQLVIPKAARKAVLNKLHASHQGIEKTKRRARQTVYWPGINSDIKSTIEACNLCQEARPSLPKEPMIYEPVPDRPFVDVSMDLFTAGGENFMVYIDRLSGWPVVCHFGSRCPNSRILITSLRRIFADTGVPIRVRCDGGPQFASFEFKQFLNRWGITMSPSSPYFPQSNGHAEAGVKAMKSLITKCMRGGTLEEEAYNAGLLEFRNTPTANGRSPSQVLFGHPLRSLVPAHHKSFAKEWQTATGSYDTKINAQKLKSADRYNSTAKNLPPLQIGTFVRMQNPRTGRWDTLGEVVGKSPYRKYTVKVPSGKVYVRNRRYLKRTQEGA